MAETSKYLLLLINFISLLAGLSVTALGFYSWAIGSQVSNLVSLGMPMMVILIGLAIMLVSGLGLYAAATENSSMLRLYFGLMMFLLLVQVVFSSLALARQADVDFQLNDAWGRAAYNDQNMVQKIEKTLGCCGFATVHDRAIPHDCIDDDEFGFYEPCRDKLSRPIKSTLRTLGVVGLILAALQGLALLMTLSLMGDMMDGGRGWGSRQAGRLQEARSLLREGDLPPHQYSSTGGAAART